MDVGPYGVTLEPAPVGVYAMVWDSVLVVSWDGVALEGPQLATPGDLVKDALVYVAHPPGGAGPMLLTAYRTETSNRCHDLLSGMDSPLPGFDWCTEMSTYDIDGDGNTDLAWPNGAQSVAQYLSGQGSYRLEVATPDPFEYAYPTADLDVDGHADLLTSDFDYELADNFGYPYWNITTSSTTRFFRGGPEGYLDTPDWVLEHEGILLWNTPLQLDGDPEIEVLGVVADVEPGWVYNLRLVRLDAKPAGPEVRVLQDVFVTKGPPHAPVVRLLPVEDVDDDGVEDLLIAFGSQLLLVGSTIDFDTLAPLWTWSDNPMVNFDDVVATDMNGDGLRDAVVLTDGFVHVIFAPFLEPPLDTAPTGHTAHTGVPHLDTSSHDTGTGPSTSRDTGTSPTPAAGHPCGCRVGSSGFLGLGPLLLLAVSRRRSPIGGC